MNKVKKFFSWLRMALEEHTVLFCLIFSQVEYFLIETMSRHGFIAALKFVVSSPLVYLYNSLIVFFVLSLCLLFKRRVFSFVLLSLIGTVCGVINGIVLTYRVTPLGAIDFQIVKMSLILVYLNKFQRVITYICAGLLVAAIAALWIFGPKINKKIKYLRSVIIIAVIGGLVACSTGLMLKFHKVSRDFGNIAGAYKDYGFVYCFTSGIVDKGINKPKDYTAANTQKILESLPEQNDETELLKPDIILIQLESFIDPKTIKGITYSDDPAPTHTYLRENFTSGKLNVPSLGGGTANTEFEVLTGISLDYFGAGEYPYKTVMLEETSESLAFNLKELGYSAHAIHNHTGNFYDRDKVYPRMGFDTFQSKEYMFNFDTTSYGWCKDRYLTGEIMTALSFTDADKGISEDTPRFVWTVSVQGHGAYPTEPVPGSENVIKLESNDYSEEMLCSLEYYVNQVWEMDMFLGSLISALKDRGKPTLLIAYGDHLPSIGLESENLTSGDAYSTEYVTWNNIGIEKAQRGELATYQLSGEIMKTLGFNNGIMTKLHQKKINEGEAFAESEYQRDIEYLAYDMLYGKHYQYKNSKKPYAKTDMRMGTIPILIDRVKSMEGSVYVQGSGFTNKSKIFINGEKQTTVMLSRSSLMIKNATIADGAKITVGQSSSKNEVLGYSNELIYRGKSYVKGEEGEEEK